MNITTLRAGALLLQVVSLALCIQLGASVGDHVLTAENNTLSVSTNTSRHARFLFPIYTVVRFVRSQCNGTNGLLGTCYLKNECTREGGVEFGPCARRLGVCCVVTRNCGGALTVSNNTYFKNPGFPATYGGGARCTISINRTSNDMCYVRLNFTALTLLQPNSNGSCINDTLIVRGTDTVVPRICGDNAGQHIYLKFRPDRTPIEVTIQTNSSVSFGRTWDILVSQHSCSDGPPNNCLQYFTGVQGIVNSFNYGTIIAPAIGTRQLANQQYAVCVRPAVGYCGILWEQASATSFTVSGDTGGLSPELLGQTIAMEKGDQCRGDFVVIPNAMQNNVPIGADRICGNALPPTTSMVAPMVLTVVTDEIEGTETPAISDVNNRGFSINYRQLECRIP